MNTEIKDILPKLIENTAVMVLYLNHFGNILFCNQKSKDILGLDHLDIIGKHWIGVLFGDKDKTINKNMFKAVIDEAMTYKREKDFTCLINQRLISWIINPVLDKDSKVEAVTLFGQDITEINERESSIKNIDTSLKDIFSSIKEYALYVINLEGNITYLGMGSEIMLGWSKKDLIFKNAGILHNASTEYPDLEFILKQVHLFGRYETEAELITKTKEVLPVILTVNQFLDADGKLTGYIFMAKDITERRKLEYQIFQSEKLAALGQLSAGMAHEINNPLFVISGRLEMLKEENFNQKVKENLALIANQTDRIRELVDRILKFSRKSTPAQEMIDINKAIEAVIPLIRYNKLPSSRIEIKQIFAKNLPKIKGDLHQLQEVFLNILTNAYQSMPEGGVIKVITSNFQDSCAEIQIIDSGVGIPEQNLKNIFMPFFSTKNDGIGLGLSICHNIIKNHNGSIELASQVNRGTTFTIRLPFI